jgi:hypothetical protein
MDKFLNIYDLPGLNHEEIENLSRLASSVTKYLPKMHKALSSIPSRGVGKGPEQNNNEQ